MKVNEQDPNADVKELVDQFADREFSLDLSSINVRKVVVKIRMPALGTGDHQA